MAQQFIEYQRDIETALDFAQARFYSSSQGRFTSVDPLLASATPANPQTLNRYTYTTNSPLNIIDPTGMFGTCPGCGLIGPMADFLLNGQTDSPQQPASGQPGSAPITTQTATLPQAELPMCYADDLPTTVTVNQVTSPDSVQQYEINGVPTLRIGVDLTFTFTNAHGEAVGGTVSESVDNLEGDPVHQDRRNMPLVNGTVSDTVATPGQRIPSRAEERAVVDNFNRPFVTRQLITVTLTTHSGVVVRVTQERTLTNQIPGASPIARGLIGGYTFTMKQPQISLGP